MIAKLAASAPAVAACVLLGAVPARAVTTIDCSGICIGLAQTPDIGSITTVATGAGATGASFAGFYGGFAVSVLASDPNPVDLASGTLDVSLPTGFGGTPGPIYVYVTETGLTSPQPTATFLSELSVTSLPSGWSETETTYVDTTAYGMGTQLASMTASASDWKDVTTTAPTAPAGSTFSVTELFEIFSDGVAGAALSTERVVDPAPAPSIGSGVSSMLAVGGILLGWKLLERRRQA